MALVLDEFGHRFGDRLDEVATRLDAAREAVVALQLPNGHATMAIGLRVE